MGIEYIIYLALTAVIYSVLTIRLLILTSMSWEDRSPNIVQDSWMAFLLI